LAQLTHAGLIVQRRKGRSLIYSADFDRMNGLVGFLAENCCGRPANPAACAPVCAPSPEAANGPGEAGDETSPIPRCDC
jgi:hypothetical protein